VFAAALAGFYQRVPVAHVEAGLRSGDIFNPYPEEVNRRLASVLTQLHFAPTPLGRDNLLAEGVPPERIVVTGNTVVDSVMLLSRLNAINGGLPPGVPNDGRKLVLLTSHRRESWGTELENICKAALDLVERFPEIRVVYPVHMNPNVRRTVESWLAGADRIHLTAPLDYLGFLSLLRRCHFVLTDSGGVQEEAPAFHKPVLVLRKTTERPEAARMGLSRVVGTSQEEIVREASRLLTSPASYRAMSQGENPYGDGRAAERIVEALARWRRGRSPVLEEWQEFSASEATAEQLAA
jgi:UDP-N-acetylglucosamine 2-epimerase (non-hydrolysing)